MKSVDWNALFLVVQKAILNKDVKIIFNSKVNTVSFSIKEAVFSLEIHRHVGSLNSAQISLYSSKYPSLLLDRHYDINGSWIVLYDRLSKLERKQKKNKKERLKTRITRKLFATYLNK